MKGIMLLTHKFVYYHDYILISVSCSKSNIFEFVIFLISYYVKYNLFLKSSIRRFSIIISSELDCASCIEIILLNIWNNINTFIINLDN